jgi:hypothetical protein
MMDAGRVAKKNAGGIDDGTGRVSMHGCRRRQLVMGVRCGSMLVIINAACRNSEAYKHGRYEGKETVNHVSHVRIVRV